jgi:hypothetical protein
LRNGGVTCKFKVLSSFNVCPRGQWRLRKPTTAQTQTLESIWIMQKDESIKVKTGIRHIVLFHNHVLRHNRILLKIGENNQYSNEELNHIQEAILIKQVSAWEQFIFNIIPYCISQNTSQLSNHLGIELPSQISEGNALAIINGVNYTSIYSTSELMEITTDLISSDFNPFQQFLPPMLRYIDEAYLLRNYISHKSHISKNKVKAFYEEMYAIHDFIIPGEFLRTKRKYEIGLVNPHEQYYFVMLQIAIFCWRFLDKDSYDKIYERNNSKEIVGLGYLNMSSFFEQLTSTFQLEDYD